MIKARSTSILVLWYWIVTSITGPSINFRLAEVVLHPTIGAMAYMPIM